MSRTMSETAVKRDDGYVLIAVMGIMIVLSLLALGAFAMSDNNLLQSKTERQRTQALHVAEAGLDAALFKVTRVNPPISLPASFTVDTGNGIAYVTITQGATASWSTVVAKGTSGENPKIVRTLTTEVFRFSGIWNMIFSATNPLTPGGNGHVNGNASFYGSCYMVGDWPTSNGNSNYEVGPFYVRNGNINLSGSSSIGSGGRVEVYWDASTHTKSGSIDATFFPQCPVIPLPQFGQSELLNGAAQAKSESLDGIMGDAQTSDTFNNETRTSGVETGTPSSVAPRSGYYKYIETDQPVTLGGAQSSWGEPFDTTLGKSPDDFAWDATNRVLTVQGTVYIGTPDLYINDIKFAGKGTIICSGNVHIDNAFEPYGATNPTASTFTAGDPVFPTKNNLGITAMGTIYEHSPNGFGPMYSGTKIDFDSGNDHHFHGAVMAPGIEFGKHMNVWVPTNMQANLPPNMPGSDPNGIISTSGWHEGKND